MADRNLLFGVLALQMDFVSREALVAGMNAWVLDKSRSLGHILQEQGTLSAEDHALLESIVHRHLQRHGDDPEQSLAVVALTASARADLSAIADRDVQASLHSVTGSAVTSEEATGPYVPSTSGNDRYRLLRPHAKGGLGEVFVAEDTELHREVALKEIQKRHARDAESRRRFLLEAEITGGLEHPGVVPVYGLGRHADGRPFYVMRFIRGDNLKDAIRRFHEADRPGRDPGDRRVAFQQLLRRYLDVCNAVAYAHSRGVLHRDLKPGNVMLGKYGETLVVDWGLAKPMGAETDADDGEETDEQMLRPASGSSLVETQAGTALGTPAFMSPEQAAGRIDQLGPGSDIYGLGATLYVLLTGRSPVEGSDIGQVLQRVERGHWLPPRQVKPQTPRALDAICRKAMALRPKDRYESALALAADIEHWLADEPVGAWREPVSARVGRWARRNRTLVAGATAACLVGTVGLVLIVVLLSVFGLRERHLKLVAQEHEIEATKQRDTARKNFRLALDTVDEYCTKVGQDVRLKERDLSGLREQLLGTAVSFYQKFIDERGVDPELRAELGRAYGRLAMLNRDMDDHDKGLELARKAIGVFEGLVQGDSKSPEYRSELASSYADLGLCYVGRANLEASVEAGRQSLDVWVQLVKEYPGEPKYALGQARAGGILGESVRLQGKLAEAERYIQDAIDLLERLRKETPGDDMVCRYLAADYRNLANTYRIGRKTKLGIPAAQQAEKLWVELAESNPKDPYYRKHQGITLHILALLYEDLHDFESAGQTFARAIAIHKDLAVNYPGLSTYQDDLSKIHANMGEYLERTGRSEEAIEEMRLAVAICEKLAARYPKAPFYQALMASTLSSLAALYRKAGKEANMADALRQAMPYLDKFECKIPLAIQTHIVLATNLGALLDLRDRKGTAEQAVEVCRWLVTVRQRLAGRPKATPADAHQVGVTYNQLAFYLARAKNYEESLSWSEKAGTALEAVPPADEKLNHTVRQARLLALQQQAWALRQLKRPAEAIAVCNRALKDAKPEEAPLLKRYRAFALADAGNHKTAVADVQEVADEPTLSGVVLYDLACVFALCSAAARKDAALPEAEREKVGEAYAVRAVALLKQAAATGYFNEPARVAHAHGDPDLDALRMRADFQHLLAGVGPKDKPP
jgi:serine/threonine-protein kinase